MRFICGPVCLVEPSSIPFKFYRVKFVCCFFFFFALQILKTKQNWWKWASERENSYFVCVCLLFVYFSADCHLQSPRIDRLVKKWSCCRCSWHSLNLSWFRIFCKPDYNIYITIHVYQRDDDIVWLQVSFKLCGRINGKMKYLMSSIIPMHKISH